MSPPRPVDALRVVSFNVRYDNPADGVNAWPVRKSRCFRAIRKLNPDLLALQEVLARPQAEVAETLADYGTIAVHRDDGKSAGEATPVYYRKSRFGLVDHGVFWLSDRPDAVGSVGWDAALTRICTWARLIDRTAGRELIIANTHFDHAGTTAQKNSASLIVQQTATLFAGLPVIVAGDLNSTDDSPAYAAFVRAKTDGGAGLVDAYRVRNARSPDEETCHDFDGRTAGRRIDYVFASPAFETLSAGIDRDRDSATLFASDHYPVWCDLAWR